MSRLPKTPPAVVQAPGHRRMPLLFALVIFGLAISAAGYFLLRSRPVTPFQRVNLGKLTDSGKTAKAAISPDGKYVAHVEGDPGQQSLWVRQVAAVRDVQIIPPSRVYYAGITFSPDSSHIFYLVKIHPDPNNILYQAPVLGGPPKKLMVGLDSPVSFSPDGTRMAFVREDNSRAEDLRSLRFEMARALLSVGAEGTTRPVATGQAGQI